MKLTRLHGDGRSGRMLLIAAGWSTAESFYDGVKMPGWDTWVVTLSGNDDNAAEIVSEMSHYKTIYLYAWSLGVSLSEVLYDHGARPTVSFAIAGTSSPVSDSEGIPELIYLSTLQLLTEKSLFKFRCRMCGGFKEFREVADMFESGGQKDINLLRGELEIAQNRPKRESLPWTLAFIPKRDAIFPCEAQERHWRRRNVSIRYLDSPHFVGIQQVIDATVVNIPRVGKCFLRGATTYSEYALAQRNIARRLADLVSDAYGDNLVVRMLEVGCGTGELSRSLGKQFKIKTATFIDLYECELFGIAEKENYIVGDAELIAEEIDDNKFDMICSSSAIQWFSDTRRFFANCRRLLVPGGILAVSTFSKGNLCELDALRESTLGYLDVEILKKMVSEYFDDVRIICEVERLSFDSASDLMRHLKLTGVTASTAKNLSPTQLRMLMKNLPIDSVGKYTLTFRPVYILAR